MTDNHITLLISLMQNGVKPLLSSKVLSDMFPTMSGSELELLMYQTWQQARDGLNPETAVYFREVLHALEAYGL